MSVEDDHKKVVVTYFNKCCNGMKGTLSIIPTLAFVDFGDAKCPEGHVGIFLPYPFENYYKLDEQ